MNTFILKKIEEINDQLVSINSSAKEFLNLGEAANYLQVSKSFLYKLTSTKGIPHYKPSGKIIYFKRSELNEWINNSKESTNEEITIAVMHKLINKENDRRIR